MNGPAQRYNRGARLLHWTIALLIIANVLLGIAHAYIDKDWPVIPLHKSIGLTVLALTMLRIAWRAGHRPPPLPTQMPSWEKGAAHGLHGVFYALMLALPLTGWVMSSAGQYPLRWFNLFDVPKFAVAKGDVLVAFSHGSHGVLGLVFGALIVLHVAAALRHHLVLKDDVLGRMTGQ